MKTLAQQNFDIMVSECFQSILKPLGFKKRANNFYRQLQDLGQIINIQKSELYSKDHINFTIAIGLFIPEYFLTHFTFHNGVIPAYPTEPTCAIRTRIGTLRNHDRDQWFDMNAKTDLDALKSEMIDCVANYILPYFDQNKTKADILALLNKPVRRLERFTRLIIYGEYGELEKAQEEYERLKQDKYTINNFQPALTEYSDKYGLKD